MVSARDKKSQVPEAQAGLQFLVHSPNERLFNPVNSPWEMDMWGLRLCLSQLLLPQGVFFGLID